MILYYQIMRHLNYAFLITAVFLAFLPSGCSKAPAKDNKVLVTFGNNSITNGAFKKRISKLPPYYQDIVNKNKKRFLEEMIAEDLFYEEAVRKGYLQDREVAEVIKEAKKKILVARLIQTEVERNASVTEDEIRKYYDEHKEDFKTPEMWRASHILVADEKEAKDILDELAKGASFEELARIRSIDATASRGGDIGYFRRGQLVPEFEKEAIALNPGQTSGVVNTQFGYHIIKLTDKRESSVEPYEKSRRPIEDILMKKKRGELFDQLVEKLKKKYDVRIDEKLFESLDDTSIAKSEGAVKK